MTPNTDTEAIAEALREATPGPWESSEGEEPEGAFQPLAWVRGQWDEYRDQYTEVTDYIEPADAHLIANAPTWLAQLLAALEAERGAHVDAIFDARDRLNAAEAALEAKDGEVERLRVAWDRSFAMLRATYPHPDHVPLVVERVIDMMAAALAPSTPKGEDHAG